MNEERAFRLLERADPVGGEEIRPTAAESRGLLELIERRRGPAAPRTLSPVGGPLVALASLAAVLLLGLGTWLVAGPGVLRMPVAEKEPAVEVVLSAAEAWSAYDAERFLDHFADDAPVPGRAGTVADPRFREEVRSLFAYFEALDGRLIVSDCRSDGDVVGCHKEYRDAFTAALGLEITGTIRTSVRDGELEVWTDFVTPFEDLYVPERTFLEWALRTRRAEAVAACGTAQGWMSGPCGEFIARHVEEWIAETGGSGS